MSGRWRYFRVLTLSKELVWFEESGHEPFVDEPTKFNAAMVDLVRPVVPSYADTHRMTSERAREGDESPAETADRSRGRNLAQAVEGGVEDEEAVVAGGAVAGPAILAKRWASSGGLDLRAVPQHHGDPGDTDPISELLESERKVASPDG